jgi:hypothetical protein
VAQALTTNEALPTNPGEVLKVIQRAEGGDAKTLPALRQLLQEPAIVDLCGGDLARPIERFLIDRAAGKNLAFKEAPTRKLELMRNELTGPAPTPLERLLVERIVTCWLHLYDTQLGFVQNRELTITQADYQQRAIDRCQRRYLAAIKALAQVRKLAVPVLQVNIARKQVNVAGGAPKEMP